MPSHLRSIHRPICDKCKSFATQELRHTSNALISVLCTKHAEGGLAAYKANIGEAKT